MRLKNEFASQHGKRCAMTPEQKLANVRAFESVVKVAAFGDTPVHPLESWCELAAIEPVGGYWYFSFKCRACGRITAAFKDWSDGNLGRPFKMYGVITSCCFCKRVVRCASEALESKQWPLLPGEVPPKSEYALTPARKYKDDPEGVPFRGPLHHYTSVNALESIVRTKKLWATNVHFLNDETESELGIELMRGVALDALKDAQGVDAHFLRHLLNWLGGAAFNSASVYVLCFSTNHNILSQWRGYTKYDQGACISLDLHMLVTRMQSVGWTFQNCRYNRTSQLTWAEAILNRMRREAAVGYSGSPEDMPRGFDQVLNGCLSELLGVAATIKHDGFIEEREVRFISPMIASGDTAIKLRPGKRVQIPYVEFDLTAPGASLAIDEVMIGPGPSQEAHQSSISAALKQQGVTGPCRVTVSRLPYREV